MKKAQIIGFQFAVELVGLNVRKWKRDYAKSRWLHGLMAMKLLLQAKLALQEKQIASKRGGAGSYDGKQAQACEKRQQYKAERRQVTFYCYCFE